ncbi:hypothetical protein [Paenibacillus tarimensis]|uniref:hypothetical protein n=1 Tax=Paenibacillus tarimensis TaxID=416012 RepID=UPI001F3C3B7D|nr:hypothetical protein [Paenibacillus tarimensis]MCF2943322.1 hypothetical protein [Paenibacillus tarimensis]
MDKMIYFQHGLSQNQDVSLYRVVQEQTDNTPVQTQKNIAAGSEIHFRVQDDTLEKVLLAWTDSAPVQESSESHNDEDKDASDQSRTAIEILLYQELIQVNVMDQHKTKLTVEAQGPPKVPANGKPQPEYIAKGGKCYMATADNQGNITIVYFSSTQPLIVSQDKPLVKPFLGEEYIDEIAKLPDGIITDPPGTNTFVIPSAVCKLNPHLGIYDLDGGSQLQWFIDLDLSKISDTKESDHSR